MDFRKYAEKRILVVDDEEFCISAIRAIFERVGINCDDQMDFCLSGEEAVTQVKMAYENGMSYKIIFTDFSMPGIDGIEATCQIRQFLKTTNAINQPSIIGITGHVQANFTKKGIEAGMDEVMSKPCYLEEMTKMLIKYGVLD